jgi:O-antigen ligase
LVVALLPFVCFSAATESFRLPKRAFAGLFLSFAAALAVAELLRRVPLRELYGLWRNRTVLAFSALLTAILFSTALSTRPDISTALLFRALPFLAFLPLAAALGRIERFDRKVENLLLATGLVTALVAIAQATRIWNPIDFAVQGELEMRGAVIGWIGDPGTLGLFLVFPFLVALDRAFAGSRWSYLVAALALGGIAASATLTAVAAALFGALLLLVTRGRHLIASPLARRIAATLVILVLTGLFVTPPVRKRILEKGRALAGANLDRLLTRRLAGWSAAATMFRERPVAGWGFGTYASRYYPTRLEALRRDPSLRQRQTQTMHFGEAHNEPLQSLAEMGLAGALPIFAVAGAILILAIRRRKEAPLEFAALGASAVAALFQFPLQTVVTSVPILLFAGRALREPSEESAPGTLPRPLGGREIAMVAACLLVAIGVGLRGIRELIGSTKQTAAVAIATEAAGMSSAVAGPALRKALFLAESALRDSPTDAGAANAIGGCLMVMGDRDGAEKAWRRASEIEPRAEFDLRVARCLWEKGERDESFRLFSNVLAYDEAAWKGVEPIPLDQTRAWEREQARSPRP